MSLNNSFKDKKVLITGHTGFKGSWLALWLEKLGSQVTGISLDPPTSPSHFKVSKLSSKISDVRLDIRNNSKLKKIIIDLKPDYIFHLAAQPLVKQSYEDPTSTWEINLMGSLSILDSLRYLDQKCTVIMITSDKCYDNVEWTWGYRENDRLGGPDPYSASKGATELLIKSYVKSFFSKKNNKIFIASARAGNVIGGGDWAKDRIIPDCVRAWSNNRKVKLRNPNATRPWQHVLEPLSGYLKLGRRLSLDSNLHGESFNFGPNSNQNYSVKELVVRMGKYWEQVKWEDVSNNSGPYESNLLKLNCDKALHKLNWKPTLNYEQTVRMTSEWYSSFYNDPSNIINKTIEQINEFEKLASTKG
tara:strand:- start:1689 stop:2768 length:1080 start_codon:yes stop_codon:yes gene_type:complete